MNMHGVLTCPRCGGETLWPTRCDCPTTEPTAAPLPDDAHYLRSILRTIIMDLPAKHDWLDPAIERAAREAIENACDLKTVREAAAALAQRPPVQGIACPECAYVFESETLAAAVTEGVERALAQRDDVLTDEDANRLEYRGNSVSYWVMRAEARGRGLDRAWQAMAKAGHPADGNTELCDEIANALGIPLKPVAWMYEHDGMVHDGDHPPVLTTRRWTSCDEPYTETPLYAAPTGIPRDDARALIQEFVTAWDESHDPTIVGSTCRLIRAEGAMRNYLADTSESGEQKSGEESDAICDPSNGKHTAERKA